MKRYCMMGIDCDPDRDVYPKLAWRGFESVANILHEVPFALNVRFDQEAQMINHPMVTRARDAGCSVGIHFHPCNKEGFYDVEAARGILESVPDQFKVSMHDGWCNHEFLVDEADAGFKLNYSPMPGAIGPQHDWEYWPNEPHWSRMLLLPVQTMKTRIARTINNIATVHPTAPPILFKRLVQEFEKTDNNTFCCYFHADELNGAIGGLRGKVYSKRNLLKNISYLRKRGYIFENAEQVYERFCACRS